MSAFVKPSQAEDATEAALLARGELFDHLGRRKILAPMPAVAPGEEAPKPKLLGYTRATTYIGALEDTTGLEKWRTRLILEGAPDTGLEGEVMLALNTLIQEQDAADAESRATEKMTKTARAELVTRPGKNYRKRLDEIAEYAFFMGGGRESAEYGTAHHELMDRWLSGRLTEAFLDETEERWPGIKFDFTAFQGAWEEFARLTGARVENSEALVVNDKLMVAGRTDLIVRCKLPGDERSRRVIMDLKTGKIEGELRLAQQLAIYAGSKHYDPETGERRDLRARQDVGIVIHAPKGEGRVSFHIIQLAPGRAANALCAKVRASRRRVPGLRTELVLEEVAP